jgi:hypothetical protein
VQLKIQTTIQTSLPIADSSFSKLPKRFQHACVAVCMQGLFTRCMPKLHSRVRDIGIRARKGKITRGAVKDQGTLCGEAHLYLYNLGIITSNLKWKIPHKYTGKGGETRVYHLSDDFFQSLLTNYAFEKKLTVKDFHHHKNTRTEFSSEAKAWFTYSKQWHKDSELKLVKEIELTKEDKFLSDNILQASKVFEKALLRCKKKIAFQNTQEFLSHKLLIEDIQSPEFAYQKALAQSKYNLTDTCGAVQGKRRPAHHAMDEVEFKKENNYNAFINILSGRALTVTQDRCGRLHTGGWECLSLSYRQYLLRSTDTYNVDGVCCQLIFISKIIGSNFTERYQALNGVSIWQAMNLCNMTKDEAKELIYTFNFEGWLSPRMRAKRDYFFKQNEALFGNYLSKLKAFHKKYSNNKYHKNANLLVQKSKQGLVSNCLGLPFDPQKNLVTWTNKKTLLQCTQMKLKNVSGKYLAHLAQGQEQQIFQEIFANLDCAFAYQYDGFFFIPKSQEDILMVAQECKAVATKFGFPELDFCIQKLSQM